MKDRRIYSRTGSLRQARPDVQKAAEISRGALANYAVAACRHFGIDHLSRVSQVNGFGFDASVGNMAMTLAVGACLVYPTDMQAASGAPLGRFIAQARLSHLSLTPSAVSATLMTRADFRGHGVHVKTAQTRRLSARNRNHVRSFESCRPRS
jgi:non-ribosomal peptide synthetase component F